MERVTVQVLFRVVETTHSLLTLAGPAVLVAVGSERVVADA